jgi:hypothetical protein
MMRLPVGWMFVRYEVRGTTKMNQSYAPVRSHSLARPSKCKHQVELPFCKSDEAAHFESSHRINI